MQRFFGHDGRGFDEVLVDLLDVLADGRDHRPDDVAPRLGLRPDEVTPALERLARLGLARRWELDGPHHDGAVYRISDMGRRFRLEEAPRRWRRRPTDWTRKDAVAQAGGSAPAPAEATEAQPVAAAPEAAGPADPPSGNGTPPRASTH